MTLNDLGPRICIMGPSNSGKSTLADAIARMRDLPAVHLDRLHHRPNTDWEPKPHTEFVALHDAAIAADRWAMDGNYSRCLPQRLARATGVILLDVSTARGLWRYVRRCRFRDRRIGGLEGAEDRIAWSMLHHIAIVTPPSRRRYRTLFASLDLPKILLATPRSLSAFYRSEGLGG